METLHCVRAAPSLAFCSLPKEQLSIVSERVTHVLVVCAGIIKTKVMHKFNKLSESVDYMKI